MSFFIPPSIQTMTSREVVTVINSLRPEGKAELRHDNFVAKLLKLKEELTLQNFQEREFKTDRGNVYTEYLLDKETCLLMVASESSKVLHAIIKRWQELETAIALPPSNDVQFDRASKLAKLCMDTLNLPQSGQLKLMADLGKQFGIPTQFLPAYGIDASPESIVTMGSSVPTMSLTAILKPYALSAKAANQILIGLGIVEERSRPSTKEGTKMFKALTTKGLQYGKNITSPNNPREVQIHWYENKVDDLLEVLGVTKKNLHA